MLKNLSFSVAICGALVIQSCGPRSLTREEIKAFEDCAYEVKQEFYQARKKLDPDKGMQICAEQIGVTVEDIESTDYDKVMFGEQ